MEAAKSLARLLAGLGAGVAAIGLVVPASQTAMRESPQTASDHRVRGAFSKIDIQAFRRDGIVVIDGALTTEELRLARVDLTAMLALEGTDDAFFQKTDQDSDEVRTDRVCWISEVVPSQRATLGTGMRDALRVVRSAPLALLAADGRGAAHLHGSHGVPLSNQLACYGAGGRYVPHRDTPGDADASFHHPLQRLLQPGLTDRVLTVILYLNEAEWDCGTDAATGASLNEGCLRCYLGANAGDNTGATSTRVLNIAPKGGRMVIFDSSKVLHEVRSFPEGDAARVARGVAGGDTQRQRAAITCWVGGAHSSYAFLRPFCVPRQEAAYFLWPST